MPRLPSVTPRRVLTALKRAGFYVHHQAGSHVNLRHAIKRHLHVVVPYHNRDLAPKTLWSIIAQTELTADEFIDLL